MQFDLGFFIGRFQPFHKGHLHVVQSALAYCDELVICIGYNQNPPCLKNPFTIKDRMALIQTHVDTYLKTSAHRVILKPVQDFKTDDQWVEAIKQNVLSASKPNSTIALIGHQKDDSTYYLTLFPKWGYIEIPNYENINATDIRKAFFAKTLFDNPDMLKHITPETTEFLKQFSI